MCAQRPLSCGCRNACAWVIVVVVCGVGGHVGGHDGVGVGGGGVGGGVLVVVMVLVVMVVEVMVVVVVVVVLVIVVVLEVVCMYCQYRKLGGVGITDEGWQAAQKRGEVEECVRL